MNKVSQDADRILALFAYDQGATDSGVKDYAFKHAVKDWRESRLAPALTECIREMTSDPYGYEDAIALVRWIESPLPDGLGVDWT